MSDRNSYTYDEVGVIYRKMELASEELSPEFDPSFDAGERSDPTFKSGLRTLHEYMRAEWLNFLTEYEPAHAKGLNFPTGEGALEEEFTFQSEGYSRRDQFSEDWDVRKNIQSRITDFSDEFVVLECLVDEDDRIFERSSFRRNIMEGVVPVEVGKYVLIRYFEKSGKCKYTFFDGDNIVNESLFESDKDYSYLNELEAFSSD